MLASALASLARRAISAMRLDRVKTPASSVTPACVPLCLALRKTETRETADMAGTQPARNRCPTGAGFVIRPNAAALGLAWASLPTENVPENRSFRPWAVEIRPRWPRPSGGGPRTRICRSARLPVALASDPLCFCFSFVFLYAFAGHSVATPAATNFFRRLLVVFNVNLRKTAFQTFRLYREWEFTHAVGKCGAMISHKRMYDALLENERHFLLEITFLRHHLQTMLTDLTSQLVFATLPNAEVEKTYSEVWRLLCLTTHVFERWIFLFALLFPGPV